MKASKKEALKKVGGIPFFVSLLVLTFLSILNVKTLPLLWDDFAFHNLRQFLLGFAVGFGFTSFGIHSSPSVFIHELKHSIVSNLAGNKAKGMKINKNSGSFSYEYSKETAAYNAFIGLAPYFLPLFTFLALLLGILFWRHERLLLLLLAGIGCGADLHLNIRDVSPIQTDITSIRGGYTIGVLYIIVMNITLVSILLAWVLQDIYGLKLLVFQLGEFLLHYIKPS